jgi:hypothetical protein
MARPSYRPRQPARVANRNRTPPANQPRPPAGTPSNPTRPAYRRPSSNASLQEKFEQNRAAREAAANQPAPPAPPHPSTVGYRPGTPTNIYTGQGGRGMIGQYRNMTTSYGPSPQPGMGNLRAEEQRQVLTGQAAQYQATAEANYPGYLHGDGWLGMGGLQRLNYGQAQMAQANRYTQMAAAYQQGNQITHPAGLTQSQQAYADRYRGLAGVNYYTGSLGTLLPDTWLGQLNRRLDQAYKPPPPPTQPGGGGGYGGWDGWGGGGGYSSPDPRRPGYGNYYRANPTPNVQDWYGQMISWNISGK